MIESYSKTVTPGDTYGRYTVLGVFKESGRTYARVQCSCNSPARYVRTDGLKNGTSKSCGCARIESVTKHGLWSNPVFNIWANMISRCYNKKNNRYSRYGGRGIKVCERWKDVSNFVADMGATFKEGLTIDRINNDGNYEPSNCQWSTRARQNRNYSRNVILHHDGKSMCVVDWASELNLNPKLIYERKKAGWSDYDALTKPAKRQGK